MVNCHVLWSDVFSASNTCKSVLVYLNYWLIFLDTHFYISWKSSLQRWIQGFRKGGGEGEGCTPPFFAIICFFFCNHFEERQIVLLKVELIINNKSLTYVYPNTIKTCLTPNHLLFGKQLLYSSNATSTVAGNLTVLSSTTDKVNRISNHFFNKWWHGYVVTLRETQRISKLNVDSLKINVNDTVLVFYEKGPRHYWRIAIVMRV